MATATPVCHPVFADNQEIIKSIVESADSCMGMCGLKHECVGFSSIPTHNNSLVTGMIGVSGEVSGFITVDLPEQFAVHAVSSLLQEELDKLSAQVLDGVGEITNLISGGIKRGLAGTKWGFSGMTVPSVIVGNNYNIAYSTGIKYVSCQFTLVDSEIFLLDERTFQVGISLIRQ